eukprot:366412-Chlamydomonas_euryale.AAC.7
MAIAAWQWQPAHAARWDIDSQVPPRKGVLRHADTLQVVFLQCGCAGSPMRCGRSVQESTLALAYLYTSVNPRSWSSEKTAVLISSPAGPICRPAEAYFPNRLRSVSWLHRCVWLPSPSRSAALTASSSASPLAALLCCFAPARDPADA